MPQLDNGEELDLTGYYEKLSRREFLRASGIVATGTLSLPTLIKQTYGTEPEGKTIVKKKDEQGRPAVVKSVDPERYKRLKAYEYFRSHELSIENAVGATIRQRSEDPTDIVIQIGIDANEISNRMKNTPKDRPMEIGENMTNEIAKEMDLPQRPRKIRGMNEAFENARRHLSKAPDVSSRIYDIPIEYTPMSTDCSKQSLKGGSSETGGTITMVGYNEDDVPVVLTAHHVAEDPSSPLEIEWDDYTINNIDDYDKTVAPSLFGQDIISFYINDIPPQEFDTNVDKALTKTEIPDIIGSWTFTGLADETSGGFINNNDYGPVYTYGNTSGKVETKIGKTVTDHKPSYLSYGAKTVDYVTENGDSGGPWVDEDGYLCGHHVGGEDNDSTGLLEDPYSIMSVADKSLNQIGVTIGVLGNNPK